MTLRAPAAQLIRFIHIHHAPVRLGIVSCFSVLLICCHLTLAAQSQLVTLPENMTRESILKRDTTKGIHHLFRARRIGAIVNIGMGLYTINSGIQMVNNIAFSNSLTNGTYFSNSASSSASFPTKVLTSLPGDLILSVGISKWIRFEKKKEIDLLAAYENGVPLPAKIQRRLRGKHLVPSTLPMPTPIPDTLINTIAVIADASISTSGVITDTLVSKSVAIPETVTVASVLHGDTVRAIQRLFNGRRGGSAGNIVLGIILTASGIGLAALVRSAHNSLNTFAGTLVSSGRSIGSPSPAPVTSPTGLSYSWPGLLITGIGLSKSARFSKDNERVLLEAYENGVPLPVSIKRKLEYKFF